MPRTDWIRVISGEHEKGGILSGMFFCVGYIPTLLF
jgi:hypothetical protein